MLTDRQIRVLTHLARSGGWVALLEIDRLRLLEEDDLVVIPSLIEDGFVEYHGSGLQAVRITPAGRAALAAATARRGE